MIEERLTLRRGRRALKSMARPAIRRLPLYHNALQQFSRAGVKTVSTTALAAAAGVSAAVVKRDFSEFGAPGKSGVGYAVASLARGIEHFLGWHNPSRAVLVGAGGLGSALLGREDIRGRNIEVVAAFDVDPDLVGTPVRGVMVYDAGRLVEITLSLRAGVGILTVPDAAAPEAASLLVAAGVAKIWSFSAIRLDVPEWVTVKREMLSAGLAELLAGPAPTEPAGKKGNRQRCGA